MKFANFATITLLAGLGKGQGCFGDNCANHVTGTFPGIGVPLESRVALCNSYLRTTLSPATTTVTSTVSIFTTSLPVQPTTTSFPIVNTTGTVEPPRTIIPTSVPPYATGQCPGAGQFSSACNCWTSVTAETTTLPTPTATYVTTRYFDVSCGPAATGVGSSPGSTFPCSRRFGDCSCLRSDGDEVCVRIGPFTGFPPATDITGPCEDLKECDINGGCEDDGYICIFDDSCDCGKRRCYRAAPGGCDYQGLPYDELQKLNII